MEADVPRRPSTGSKSEWLRFLLGVAAAAIVAYYTAQSALEKEIATVKATEQNHFEEVLRSLGRIEGDVRELRSRTK